MLIVHFIFHSVEFFIHSMYKEFIIIYLYILINIVIFLYGSWCRMKDIKRGKKIEDKKN